MFRKIIKIEKKKSIGIEKYIIFTKMRVPEIRNQYIDCENN